MRGMWCPSALAIYSQTDNDRKRPAAAVVDPYSFLVRQCKFKAAVVIDKVAGNF